MQHWMKCVLTSALVCATGTLSRTTVHFNEHIALVQRHAKASEFHDKPLRAVIEEALATVRNQTGSPADTSFETQSLATTRDCEKWCSGSSYDWTTKCIWNKCGGCTECGTPCVQWCHFDTRPWPKKCGFSNKCSQCPACQTPDPTTPHPTAAPTAALTHSPLPCSSYYRNCPMPRCTYTMDGCLDPCDVTDGSGSSNVQSCACGEFSAEPDICYKGWNPVCTVTSTGDGSCSSLPTQAPTPQPTPAPCSGFTSQSCPSSYCRVTSSGCEARYFLKKSGTCPQHVKSLDECGIAAQALGLRDITATNDGTSGQRYYPPYCYIIYGNLKYNENLNLGECYFEYDSNAGCICEDAPTPPPTAPACIDSTVTGRWTGHRRRGGAATCKQLIPDCQGSADIQRICPVSCGVCQGCTSITSQNACTAESDCVWTGNTCKAACSSSYSWDTCPSSHCTWTGSSCDEASTNP